MLSPDWRAAAPQTPKTPPSRPTLAGPDLFSPSPLQLSESVTVALYELEQRRPLPDPTTPRMRIRPLAGERVAPQHVRSVSMPAGLRTPYSSPRPAAQPLPSRPSSAMGAFERPASSSFVGAGATGVSVHASPMALDVPAPSTYNRFAPALVPLPSLVEPQRPSPVAQLIDGLIRTHLQGSPMAVDTPPQADNSDFFAAVQTPAPFDAAATDFMTPDPLSRWSPETPRQPIGLGIEGLFGRSSLFGGDGLQGQDNESPSTSQPSLGSPFSEAPRWTYTLLSPELSPIRWDENEDVDYGVAIQEDANVEVAEYTLSDMEYSPASPLGLPSSFTGATGHSR